MNFAPCKHIGCASIPFHTFILQLISFYCFPSFISQQPYSENLKFNQKNKFMPGLLFSFSTATYIIYRWFSDYAFSYSFHDYDQDFAFREGFIWDDIAKLSKAMFLDQIAIVLVAFQFKYVKILKYFNYAIFFLFLFRLICKWIFMFIPKVNPFTLPVIKDVIYNDNPNYFRLFYGFLYLVTLLLINFCFVFSKIRNWIPKHECNKIYICTFFLVVGLFSTEFLQQMRYSTNMYGFNYFRFAVNCIINYCVDHSLLIIIWVLSEPEYNNDQQTQDVLYSGMGLID